MDAGDARDYDVLGRRVSIAGSSPAARAVIARVFRGFDRIDPRDAPGHASAAHRIPPRFELSAAGSAWEVRHAGTVAYAGPDLTAALAALESQIVVTALLDRSDLVGLHAAALCLPTRLEGLAIAGASGTGKTTLAVALMLRGFLPFSDDLALFDAETLTLAPLRRAFHLSAHSRALVAQAAGTSIDWDEADPAGVFSPPQFAERPAPIKWLCFLERRPDESPRLVALSPSDAAMAILTHTVGLSAQPRRALDACGRLTREARCFRLVTGDLAASVDAVRQVMGAESAVV